MSPPDAESFVRLLERSGLTHLENGQSIDLVVVDQLHGLASPCPWAEFGHVNLGNDSNKRIAACRFAGSTNKQVVTPPSWTFESSLSRSYGFAPSEHIDKSLTYLRHENGLDVYLNSVTGEEVYIGRTGEDTA
jgi:hypothetical protein